MNDEYKPKDMYLLQYRDHYLDPQDAMDGTATYSHENPLFATSLEALCTYVDIIDLTLISTGADIHTVIVDEKMTRWVCLSKDILHPKFTELKPWPNEENFWEQAKALDIICYFRGA